MSSVVDPLGLFDESKSSKLAREQWEWQKEKYDENFELQKSYADREFAWATNQIKYQRQMDRLQLQREDEAVQRRVADLEAAGLSPTLAAGSAAEVNPVHAMNGPSVAAPQHMLGVNPRIEAEMFKEQMQKERLALAMSVLGNIADVSRTKAETELITAQKDRYVAETPTELRIKEELAMLNEELHSYKVDQAKQDLTNSEADYITKLWDHVSSQDDHLLKTTQLVREELGVKLDEQALRIGASEENIKKTEALIKGLSLQLEQYKVDTEKQLQDFYKNLGVPRGVHDKPSYAPFTLIRGLVEGLDKGGSYLWDKASSGLKKLPGFKFRPTEKAFIYNSKK